LFESLRTKIAEPRLEIRDTLFGDIPLKQFLLVKPQALSVDPWASFARAGKLIDAGNTRAATEVLQAILKMPQLESRHALQAWHYLRELGEHPPQQEAKRLLGLVVEVQMPKGLDLVAAYSDHHARYFNFSGSGVAWEHPNGSLDEEIDYVLEAGNIVLKGMGPWDGHRPSAPPNGHARINLLTPAGLHFGEGPIDLLGKDKLGGAILGAAYQLMQKLTGLTHA
jgi:hypothetical protein